MSRETAFEVLRSGSSTPMREVNHFAERFELDARDRGLARALVGCEVRRRATLRAIVKVFTRGNPSAEVLTLLRLGAAQLLFMDSVPDHAAVSETVRVATDRISLPRGRYVNGVLRTLQRARVEGHCGDPRQDIVGANWHFALPIFRDPEEHPLLWAEDALSIPSNLFKRWHKRFGMEAACELAKQALAEADLSVAVCQGTREALLERFAETPGQLAQHPDVVVFPSSAAGDLLASPEFEAGQFTVQGETAVRAADAVGAQAGERILDLCAAPGGKTARLARSGASVTAIDVSDSKLNLIGSTLTRLGLGENVTLVESDGTQGLSPDTPLFDGGLVDAPCSNTGVLAARPGARWRFGPQTQKELVALQARLLDEASQWIRPGGRLVYSTCSIETDENQQQIRNFLAGHEDWSLEHQEQFLPGPQGSPGPVDGGFHARLIRSV